MRISQSFKGDVKAYYGLEHDPNMWFFLKRLILEVGLQFVFLTRIQLHLVSRNRFRMARLIHLLNLKSTGGEVSFTATIGPAFVVKHPNGVLIGEQVTLGKNCTLLKGVTFGLRDVRDLSGQPQTTSVGDSCVIGTHAVILSGVDLGDHCNVGANSVVTKSFPSNTTVVGIPARAIDESRP